MVQIERMDSTLRSQQNKVIEHQEYFAHSGLSRYHLPTLIVLVSAFFIGWTAERRQWSGKVMRQVVDIGKLAVLNSVKKTLVSFLK